MAHPCAVIPCSRPEPCSGHTRQPDSALTRCAVAVLGPIPETAVRKALPAPGVQSPGISLNRYTVRIQSNDTCSNDHDLDPWRHADGAAAESASSSGNPIASPAEHASFNCESAKFPSPVHRRASSAPLSLHERSFGRPCPNPSFNSSAGAFPLNCIFYRQL